jgi:hypothetical protein
MLPRFPPPPVLLSATARLGIGDRREIHRDHVSLTLWVAVARPSPLVTDASDRDRRQGHD